MQLPSEVINPALNWLNNNFTLDQVDPDHLDFGSPDQKFEFPTLIEPLDDLVLNEHLIVAVQQLLDSVDIRLLQADLWPKIGVRILGSWLLAISALMLALELAGMGSL